MNIVQKGTELERLEYFSEWDLARRAVAGCLRFKDLIKERLIKNLQGTVSVSNMPIRSASNYTPSTVKELQKAEVEILRLAQETCFAQELESLSRQTSADDRKSVISKESKLYRLDPFHDKDGLIRVGGRMHYSSADFAQNHPVLLPRKGHVTRLLIRHCHERVQHQGRGMTINELRSNGYWILGCSSAVSDLIYH